MRKHTYEFILERSKRHIFAKRQNSQELDEDLLHKYQRQQDSALLEQASFFSWTLSLKAGQAFKKGN